MTLDYSGNWKKDHTYISGHDSYDINWVCLYPRIKEYNNNISNFIDWLEKNVIINERQMKIDDIRIDSSDILLIVDYIRYLERQLDKNYNE